ncbi:hypothetical protein [Pseudochryseolinea flava]|uniref:Uncharacterized protein n=1 Tax=Pseudochryseolinea flava TaxID=2059302 RepID=A0A364XV36_9BACT|nr:hypothetical protein [Pseudochryseolinea flava]RAV98200.1 hypothetical protein DQQ10_24660 [Pseudochryseolinea flava]
MKNIYAILSLVVLGFVFVNCGGSDSDDPATITDQQKAAKALKDGSPWAVVSVDAKPDGADAEALDGLEFSFGTTGSGVDIAPASFESDGVEALASDPGATWNWDGAGIGTIKLNHAFTTRLTNVQVLPNLDAPTSVKVTFELASIGGRTEGVGEYTVTLE